VRRGKKKVGKKTEKEELTAEGGKKKGKEEKHIEEQEAEEKIEMQFERRGWREKIRDTQQADGQAREKFIAEADREGRG
jgi:hypothetical protein